MKGLSIYFYNNTIIFSYKAKYNDGLVRETGKFQIYALTDKMELLSKALIDVLNDFEEGLIYSKDLPKLYTKNIVKVTHSKSYKEFVKGSSMISLVLTNNNIIKFQTLESSKKYIGYGPYNQNIEEFDLSNTEIEKVMYRIIEVLKEVISKY